MNGMAIEKKSLRLPGLFALVLGILFGLFLAWIMTTPMETEWMVAALFMMTLPLLICLSRSAERFFIFILMMALVLNIDITLNRVEHIGGAAGFIVSVRDFALIGLIAVWGIQSGRQKINPFIIRTRDWMPLLFLVLFALLSFFASDHIHLSLYEFLELLKMLLVFICISSYIARTGQLKFVLAGMIAGLCLEIIIGFAQVVFDSTFGLTSLGMREEGTHFILGTEQVHRISGTLGSTNGLAWYLDFILPVVFSLFFIRMRHFLRIGLGVIFTGGCTILLWTYSRGGWIGFVIGLVLVGVWMMTRIKPLRRIQLSFILVIIVGTGLFLLAVLPNVVKQRFTQDDSGAAYVRLPLMEVAVSMILKHPITGVGLNTYTEVDQEYDLTEENVTLIFPQPVHNIYLQLGAEIGVPGLFCFFWFIGLLAFRARDAYNRSQGIIRHSIPGIVGGLVAFLIHGLVSNGSIASYHFLPFWFFSGTIIGIHRYASDKDLSNNVPNDSEDKR